MIAVSSIPSTAATALELLSATKGNNAASTKAAPGLNPVSARSLSPSVSDALLEINEIVNAKAASEIARRQPADARLRLDGYDYGPMTKLSDLPPDHAKKLRALGADAAVKVTASPIGDEEFKAMMLAYANEAWSDLDGFNEALANGTLRIQRASGVPELRLGHVSYNLYSNGNHIGGAGFGNQKANLDLYLQIQSQGVRQATGSINGHDFYVTWPDASLAKAA